MIRKIDEIYLRVNAVVGPNVLKNAHSKDKPKISSV